MKKIAVTGVTGFVGSALANFLIGRGYKVLGVARNRLGENLGYPLVDFDLAKDNGSEIDLSECDILIHLAAHVHVMKGGAKKSLNDFLAVNAIGTERLALAAARAGVKRFIYLSSVKVNGELTHGKPFSESDQPAPLDAYAISKNEAELVLKRVANQTGMELVIIRPPLIYGTGVKANFLRLVRWLKKGVPLPLGGIHNQRSLLGLDNLLDFILLCIEHPAAANETFLVSDGQDVSTTELLRRMSLLIDKPGFLIPIPSVVLSLIFNALGRRDFSQRLLGSLQVDISKAKDLLGWVPPNTLDEGLRRIMIEK